MKPNSLTNLKKECTDALCIRKNRFATDNSLKKRKVRKFKSEQELVGLILHLEESMSKISYQTKYGFGLNISIPENALSIYG